jgi:hypothetical protein
MDPVASSAVAVGLVASSVGVVGVVFFEFLYLQLRQTLF